ncbi:hypothetical protein [uncultured Fibrella sp.]|uniref:hypothetical protein n=1 Tax=uncultured Fibrella sp. TaxID=1284596 RepID=UPI0035C9A441
MGIEQLLHLVELYLNSRSRVLLALESRGYRRAELQRVLQVHPNVLDRRQRNPALWRPGELRQLADELGTSAWGIMGIRILAAQLFLLPESFRRQLYKETQLNKTKLDTRYNDYDTWQYEEVWRLACTLRRWRDVNARY